MYGLCFCRNDHPSSVIVGKAKPTVDEIEYYYINYEINS